MAKQTINIGTTANDGTGDPIRAAFGKVNDNFTEIYTANTGTNTGDQNLSAYATTAAVAAGYQPLDSDLTAISALTTTAYGRALLSTTDAATLRSAIGVGTTDAPTFLAQTLTANGSNTSPSLKIGAGAYINGWYSFGGLQLNGVVNSINMFGINTAGTNIANGHLSFGSGNLKLEQDADGILAQRNGVNAQAFRVYNTTDGTNTEYGSIAWIGGAFEIGSKAAGTGATRHTKISSVNRIYLNTGGTDRWSVETTGHLLAGADNTYDIGASGANRPRNIYAGTSVISSGVSSFEGVNLKASGGSVRLTSPAYGVMSLLDSDGTGNFTRINIGGTTSAFPAIKRNGAGIDIRLADDSGAAPLSAGLIIGSQLQSSTWCLVGSTSAYYFLNRGGMEAPSDGVVRFINQANNGFTRVELGTSNLGISRGTGSPEGVVTALVGSLYIRTDGGASTTLYVKESGTGNTGWVAK